MPSGSEESFLERLGSKVTNRRLRRRFDAMTFNDAFDKMRSWARELTEEGKAKEVMTRIENFASLIDRKGGLSGKSGDLYAALMQTLTSVYVSLGMSEEAMRTAASTLTLLSQESRRRDEPFQVILALTLHDLALLHSQRSKFRHAEREIEKSMKIFDRLAKANPERYASALVAAQSTLTSVLKSRTSQANLLKEHQEATERYMQMMNEGVEEATTLLVDSLAEEGRTLAHMGKDREAVQYFSRALKYLTKIEPEMTLRQLRLSIDLGEALMNVKQTREKGVHLLNTMLYKASKLHAAEDLRRIKEVLSEEKSKHLDILSFWYKLFPK